MKKSLSFLSQWIEEKSPETARRFLSYASRAVDPSLWTSRLEVMKWSDEEVVIRLPFWWRVPGVFRELPSSAVVAAAENALGLFWQRHLDPQVAEFSIQSLHLELGESLKEAVLISLQVGRSDSQEWLFRLQSKREFTEQVQVELFNSNGRRLGTVQMGFSMRMEGGKTLLGTGKVNAED